MKKVIALMFIGLAIISPAKADSLTSALNFISNPSIGSGTLGMVTLTQNNANAVEFNVALNPNTAFVSTGGPHNAFTFNLDLLSPYTVTLNGASADYFVYNGGPASNTPYGSFSNVIDCPGCGPGASNAYYDVLDFTVAAPGGISLNDFIGNAKGYYFSADVIGPSGGTGNIASKTVTMTTVPEPQTYAMMLAGLTLIGFIPRRKKDLAV